jgi:Protein of unknown function (DUF1706)
MDLNGLLDYAYGFVNKSSATLEETGRTEELACGIWSVRDVIGHLYSFKHLVEDVLSTFLGNTDTPYLKLMHELGPDSFGEEQVATRQNISFTENLAEYQASHLRMMALLAQIPEEEIHRPGTLPWYGTQYALDDFILYTDFGHQIEHASQLALLRNKPVAGVVSSLA